MSDSRKKLTIPSNYNSLSPRERAIVRNEYRERQLGLCAHCGHKLSDQPAPHVLEKKLDMTLFPKNFLDHPVHLHHDHKTGMTKSVVHAYCNGVLWQYYGE